MRSRALLLVLFLVDIPTLYAKHCSHVRLAEAIRECSRHETRVYVGPSVAQRNGVQRFRASINAVKHANAQQREGRNSKHYSCKGSPLR